MQCQFVLGFVDMGNSGGKNAIAYIMTQSLKEIFMTDLMYLSKLQFNSFKF
jgi:hypothetical protein